METLSSVLDVPWPCWLIRALVAWAYFATRSRPASGVLALAWTMAEAYSIRTGDRVPTEIYLATDFIILAALLNWAGGWKDTVIASILVMQLKCYLDLRHGSVQQWWSLWSLTCIQMALAGPWDAIVRQPSRVRGIVLGRSPLIQRRPDGAPAYEPVAPLHLYDSIGRDLHRA